MKFPFKCSLTGSLMLALTILFLSNATKAQVNSQTETQGQTVYEVVNSKENTSEFAALLDKSGYAQILKQQESSFTVLAPNNKAIQNADSELKSNPKKLMQGQLFKGQVSKDQVESQMGVTVQETDDSAANGVVYVVDSVVKQ